MSDLRAQAFSVAHVTGEKRPVVFLHVAETEVGRLRDALDRYGEHDRSCGVHLSKPCSCGLHAAMGLCTTCDGERVVRMEAQLEGVPAQEAPCPDCAHAPATPRKGPTMKSCPTCGCKLAPCPTCAKNGCATCAALTAPPSSDHRATPDEPGER